MAKSEQVAKDVIASVHEIQEADFHGCAPNATVPALGDMASTSEPDRAAALALCWYDTGVDGPNLVASEGIEDPADIESLWLGLDSADAGTGPDSGPDTCIDWPEEAAVLIRSGGRELAWVHYDGCSGHGIDLGGTTYKLSEQVMYWALPCGGFGVGGWSRCRKERRP